MLTDRKCSIEPCNEKHKAKGFCSKHYERYRAHKNPLFTLPMGRPNKFKSLQEHFESKFIKDNKSKCWPWLGSINQDGYGKFQPYIDKKAHTYVASRFSYKLYVSEITPNMNVCHTCDNPICVNPNHLFLGTNKENLNDMIKKGRSMKGERNNKAKLSETDVIEIRNQLSFGTKIAALARLYNVHTETISRIKSYKMWRHIC